LKIFLDNRDSLESSTTRITASDAGSCACHFAKSPFSSGNKTSLPEYVQGNCSQNYVETKAPAKPLYG
jgi:hypothetical protein